MSFMSNMEMLTLKFIGSNSLVRTFVTCLIVEMERSWMSLL